MKQNSESFVHRLCKDQRGQVLPIVAFLMVSMLGFTGLVIDFGHVYFTHRLLQNSTDAAALAGAQSLPNTTAATVATQFSSVSGNKNAYSNLQNVTMVSGYPQVKCLSTLTGQGIPCVAPANANAVQVKQQVSVPTYFLKLFGFPSVQLTATATASMRGAAVAQYNVAIIVDATASMKDTDKDSNCNSTRISCALSGVRILLSGLTPCAASGCSSAFDRVSLYVFPGVTSGTAKYDYNCSSSTPTSVKYSTAMPSSSAGVYQIIPFSSDYRSSNTSTSLSTSSNLVVASAGKSSCSGVQAVGGQGTFYAGVINAAQADLVAEQTTYPTTQNVMILLSDGDAEASSSQLSGYSTSKECQQAVTAANNATAAGTRVYAIAYGAEASGCGNDVSPYKNPCYTMQHIASDASTFFSDYTATGGSSSCISASRPTTSLNQIFTEIVGDLSVARLIPDGTT